MAAPLSRKLPVTSLWGTALNTEPSAYCRQLGEVRRHAAGLVAVKRLVAEHGMSGIDAVGGSSTGA
jgi:hypothetical protein